LILAAVTGVTAMATVTAMHENVHQRASKNRQPDKYSEDVGAVLGEQKRTSDDKKSDENETRSRR
jgi:hypothetical protein